MSSIESIFQVQNKLRSELGLHKVKAIPNPNYERNGVKSYVYLLSRYGFQPTQPGPYFHKKTIHQRGLVNSKVAQGGRLRFHSELVKRTSGSDAASGHKEVTAEDQQNDSMYICEVQIGTPAQTLKLDFDTGSSDLWVFSTSTQVVGKGQSGKISGHNAFDPRKSSTWKDSAHQAWQISYGDGSTASGTVGTDVVSIGGLKIQKQSIEMASQLSSQFAQGSSDGLLGLAFPSINTITSNGRADPQPTPVANMIRQGDIPKNTELFTSAFYSSKDKAADSFYTFGFIDQDLVKASGKDIVWTDIDNSQGFWMFASTSATINGKKVTRDNNTAIADTGTTLALVSDDVCEALYGAIKGATYSEEQQGWLIPTSVTAADLPNFSLAVGDTEFTIQKEDLLFAAADDKNWYGGVQSRGENPFDILGDTFLKSIYAIWDQGNNRFGAVPKIEPTQNIDPPTSDSYGN